MKNQAILDAQKVIELMEASVFGLELSPAERRLFIVNYNELLTAQEGKVTQNDYQGDTKNTGQEGESVRRTSEEWRTQIYDFGVYDPDGWDRKNFQYSWFEEKITWSEYETRAMKSTLSGHTAQEGEIKCPDCSQVDCPYFQQEGEYPTLSQFQKLIRDYQEGCEIQLYPDGAYEYIAQHEAHLSTFILDNTAQEENK